MFKKGLSFRLSADEAAVEGVLATDMDENIRTKTLRAFIPKEFGKMI